MDFPESCVLSRAKATEMLAIEVKIYCDAISTSNSTVYNTTHIIMMNCAHRLNDYGIPKNMFYAAIAEEISKRELTMKKQIFST